VLDKQSIRMFRLSLLLMSICELSLRCNTHRERFNLHHYVSFLALLRHALFSVRIYSSHPVDQLNSRSNVLSDDPGAFNYGPRNLVRLTPNPLLSPKPVTHSLRAVPLAHTTNMAF
jgi:hypothetical protein